MTTIKENNTKRELFNARLDKLGSAIAGLGDSSEKTEIVSRLQDCYWKDGDDVTSDAAAHAKKADHGHRRPHPH